jgi:hypothetical protein
MDVPSIKVQSDTSGSLDESVRDLLRCPDRLTDD